MQVLFYFFSCWLSRKSRAACCCCVLFYFLARNYSKCKARPGWSIENNIIVAKFSMQIRPTKVFYWRRRGESVFMSIFRPNGSMAIFYGTENFHSFSRRNNLRDFTRFSSFNCLEREKTRTARIVTSFFSIIAFYLDPNHQFDSISHSSDDLKRFLRYWLVSCESSRHLIGLCGRFNTFLRFYFREKYF